MGAFDSCERAGIRRSALIVPATKPKTFTFGKLTILVKTRGPSLAEPGFTARPASASIIPACLSLSETINLYQGRLKLTLGGKKEKVAIDFLCEINKVSLYFYESCPGLLQRRLVFGIGCNEMFAHLLTFLSRNSKSPNLNALINFLPVFLWTF